MKKWTSINHLELCKNENCSFAVNVDGNWKCFRLKCAFEDAHIISDELKPIKIDCTETPERGSYYCQNHSSMQEIVFFNVFNEKWPFDALNIKSQVKGLITADRSIIIQDYFENHLGVVYFLLTDTEQKNGVPFWATENQVPKRIIENFYKNEKTSNSEINCMTRKTVKCEKKTTKRGILISAFNCGIVCGYREIYGLESKNQVALFLMDIYTHFAKIPKFTIYDDACHLKKYVEKLNGFKNINNRCNFFSATTFVVDKLHIKNHVDREYCLKYCDPSKYKELNDINTVVCEDINSWLSGFKHNVKHMNKVRYSFFMFIMLNKYNERQS